MRSDLLDYELPPELIATRPLASRDGSRLCVVRTDSNPCRVEHRWVRELDTLIPEGALVVLNDTRVVAARLFGKKRGTGGKVELFLVRRLPDVDRWVVMGRASKPIRVGSQIEIAEDADDAERGNANIAQSAQIKRKTPMLLATVEARDDATGLLSVALSSPNGGDVNEALEVLGHMPLPHYLHREDDAADRVRYQTVFARVPGAVAAPTAGLHLSEALLARLGERGISIANVTLHVGLGTFQPVTVDDLDEHRMHEETFHVGEETAEAVARAKERRAPIVAVGTTVVRALESAADPEHEGWVKPTAGETRLLIQPGYPFRIVDALMTNFHLPRSTLLALVFAFAGRENVLAAYQSAIEARYRFYSYGDAMLMARHPSFFCAGGAFGQ